MNAVPALLILALLACANLSPAATSVRDLGLKGDGQTGDLNGAESSQQPEPAKPFPMSIGDPADHLSKMKRASAPIAG